VHNCLILNCFWAVKAGVINKISKKKDNIFGKPEYLEMAENLMVVIL
jgi:hypothetical protein